jgi:hypothetical protein
MGRPLAPDSALVRSFAPTLALLGPCSCSSSLLPVRYGIGIETVQRAAPRTLSEIGSASASERGFSSRASMLRSPATLQLKSGLCYPSASTINHSSSWISSDAPSDRLRFFLRLGRCLLWLFRCGCWALFKDNLSFPGNVGADDLLSKLLQIQFDIRDSLFQGFVFVWHMLVPI